MGEHSTYQNLFHIMMNKSFHSPGVSKLRFQAESLGNYPLHLFSFAEVLKYLAAAGHNNKQSQAIYIYYIYLQELEITHPHVHHHFSNGLFVVHRSDRLLAKIPSDQVIEQCLIRNFVQKMTNTTRNSHKSVRFQSYLYPA